MLEWRSQKFMNKNSSIYVAGHMGLVGSALVKFLKYQGFEKIITIDKNQLNLLNQDAVFKFLSNNKPEYVFLAAARVGGILANAARPADFIYENLQIQNNIIHGSHLSGIKKLLFLGSSCIYPKFSKQPIKESELLSGCLEPTNEAYALAKIAGLKMCSYYKKQFGDNFISCMPTNLYGIGDNFDEANSHVIPALINKFLKGKIKNAKSVTCLGTGNSRREFLYVDDMASACVFLMQKYEEEDTINIGTGKDIPIKNLAEMIANKIGYEGEIVWDTSAPDGTPRKVLDVKKIEELGWSPSISLDEGLEKTLEWFKKVKTWE